MKLAISKEDEILHINNIFKECTWLCDELKWSDLKDLNDDDFEIFKNFRRDDPEGFLKDLLRTMKNSFWEKMIWNLETLLENCADKTKDHLDFNTELKRGFHAIELLKTINECLSEEKEIPDYKKQIQELLTKETFE